MSPTVFEQPTALLNQSTLAGIIDDLQKQRLPLKKSDPESLLNQDGFLDFLDEIVDTIDNLVSSKTTNTIPVNFSKLIKAVAATEDKNQVRYFLNLLFTEINRQNPQVLNQMPLFLLPDGEKTDEEIEKRDEEVRSYLLKDEKGLEELRKFADIQLEDQSDEEQNKKDEKKDEPTKKESREEDDEGLGELPFRKRAVSSAAVPNIVQGDLVPPANDIKEGFRSIDVITGFAVNQVEIILLNQFLENNFEQFADNYKKPWGDTLLPPELDYSIRTFVLDGLTQNFDKFVDDQGQFDRNAFSVWASQQVLRKYPNIFIQLDQLSNSYLKSLDVQTSAKVYEQVIETLETTPTPEKTLEESDKRFAEKRDKAFKQELEHILAYSVLSSSESIEELATKIVDYFPEAYGHGTEGIDRYELQQILQLRSQYSVNIDEVEKIYTQIDSFLKKQGVGRLQTREGRAQLKTELSAQLQGSLVSVAVDKKDLDRAVSQIIQVCSQTSDLDSITADSIRQALPQSDDKVIGEILAYIKTGNLKVFTTTTLSSAKTTLQIKKQDPKAAIRKLLGSYSTAQGDGFDATAQNLLNKLDTLALTNLSVENLDTALQSIIQENLPELAGNQEFFSYLQAHVLEMKGFEAGYTKNPFIAYFPTEQELADVTVEMESTSKILTRNETDVTALAYFYYKPVINPAEAPDKREEVKFEKAEKLRQFILAQKIAEYESARKSLAQKEQEEFARQLFGLASENYQVTLPNGQQQTDQDAFNAEATQQLINAEAWNAPQNGDYGHWNGANNSRLKRLKGEGLKNAAQKIISSQAGKVAAVGVGAGGAGLAVYGLLQNVVGAVGAGIGGGATTGAIIGGYLGSVFPVVGTAVGAITGGIVGGIAGGVIAAQAQTGGGGALSSASSMSASAKAAIGDFARPAATNATNFVGGLPEVFTASTATMTATSTAVAVVAPILAVSALSIISISMVVGAFLPDASSTQVAPYFSLDLNQSRYITLKKEATPTNNATPTQIKYSISLSKKEEAVEDLTIVRMEDTMKVINKDSVPVDPPALPQEAIDFFTSLEGTSITTTPITFEFTVDATDPRFTNTLITNDIKVIFTQNGTEETSTSRALSCIGDCPKVTVPACWPSDGRVTQLPRARGGPVSASNNQLNSGTSTHARFNAQLPNDAYDIGAGGLVDKFPPIYSVADGVVLFAGWYGSQADPSSIIKDRRDLLLDWNYGNLTIIDHGTFVSYYAHQSQIDVQVGQGVTGGQKIGLVGTTGNSSGNHLHYEVRGFSEYVLYQTLNGDMEDPATPLCNEYYGKN